MRTLYLSLRNLSVEARLGVYDVSAPKTKVSAGGQTVSMSSTIASRERLKQFEVNK
jgi:hypothetical protein